MGRSLQKNGKAPLVCIQQPKGPVLGVDNREVWHVQPIVQQHDVVKHSKRPLTVDPSHQPIVRMISISTHRRGTLDKRMQSSPFRSVLSLDIEYKGAMPNLKISNRNTIQATGCQDMQILGEILGFLVHTYRNRVGPLPPAPNRGSRDVDEPASPRHVCR